MHHLQILTISLCAMLVIGCASGNHHPVQLTVMTYNIHHGAGMDGKVDLPRLARVILQSKADLIALQEVDNGAKRTGGIDETTELGKLTGMHALFARAMDFEGGQYGDAILSRYPILREKQLTLPHTAEGEHEPRALLAVRCNTSAGEFLFASTHLDQVREPSDRLPQTKTIIEALAVEELPIILGGDFNCHPHSEPVAELEKTWKRVTDDQPSDPSINPKSKIDHIFVKPPLRWRVIETHVVEDALASDHRPVVATLELLPETH